MNKFIDHQIIARKVHFDFSQTPRHWVPDDVLATHVLNSMHVLLPAVEHWFCRLANKTLPYINDKNLKADIRGFIAQEAAHANAHKGAEIYFQTHGIDPTPFKHFLEWMFKDGFMGDTPFGIYGPFKRYSKQWLAFRMGIIAGLEHYFCFFGTWVLDAEGLEHADPAMLDIVRWHGAEEVEHRTVGYDAYRALAGDHLTGYLGRQLSMSFAFIAMVGFWLGASVYLCKLDNTPEAKRISRKNPLALIWEFQQTAKQKKSLPDLVMILTALKGWSKFNYHPEHDGDVKKALAYIANSPAAQQVAEAYAQALAAKMNR